MPNFDFNTFLEYKDQLKWEQVKVWTRGGSKKHLIWKGYKTSKEGDKVYVARRIPMFFIYVTIDDPTGNAMVSLFINWRFDPNGKDQMKIDGPHPMGKKDEISDEFIREYLRERYGVTEVDFKATPVGGQVFNTVKSVMMRASMVNKATKMLANVFLRKFTSEGSMQPYYKVDTVISSTKEGVQSTNAASREKKPYKDIKEATADYYRTIRQLNSVGFEEMKGIPEDANESNWNFELGMTADVAKAYESVIQQMDVSDLIPDQYDLGGVDINWGLATDRTSWYRGPLRSSEDQSEKKNVRKAQSKGYESWYSGAIPDSSVLAPYRGTSSVDASQLRSIFGGTDEAIGLVNQFNGNLLKPIAFIFNFSAGGAFGVFVSALDDKIKADKVKDDMAREGYEIEEFPNGSFAASHPDKSQNEIKADMDRRYNSENLKGGATFGIDMNKTLASARSDASKIGNVDEEDFRKIAVLKVAQTMVHEATHAAGAESEGPAEAAASQFLAWASQNVLPKMNEERKKKLESKGIPFAPIFISEGGHPIGKASGWYPKAKNILKEAQFGAQFPTPKNLSYQEMSVAPWASIFWNYEIGATESMLNRSRPQQDIHSLPEKMMRDMEAKKWDNQVDATESIESLLIRDRQPLQGYKATETLMEDRRVKPLMVPVTKGASSKTVVKTAGDSGCAFGFMNNLDLPMEERVWSDSSPESDTWLDWTKIRKQQRYNPEYGPSYSKTNGIFSWWRELKWEPELWSQMLDNRPFMSSPAKRFASEGNNIKDPVLVGMVLMAAHKGIENGDIKGTRFLCSEYIKDRILEYFDGHPDIVTLAFPDNKVKGCCAVWVVGKDIDTSTVHLAEEYFSDDESEESREAFEQICGIESGRKAVIDKILSEAKNLCKEFGVEDMYVVGGLPRSMAMGDMSSEVSDLDFSAAWPDQCIKIGGLLAERLGAASPEFFHRTMTMSWRWGGIKCDFRGNFTPVSVRDMLREQDLKTTPLNLDIYARDFTINMLVYSLKDGKVYDVTKSGIKDIKAKTIKTFFDPDKIVQQNPIIIPRAVKYAVRYGFTIDPKLSTAMKKHVDLLFGGKYSSERLEIAWEEAVKEGKEAIPLLEEYGLGRLRKQEDSHADSN